MKPGSAGFLFSLLYSPMSDDTSQNSNLAAKAWHSLGTDEVITAWQSDSHNGLDAESVSQRQQQFGPNAIPEKQQRGIGAIILTQFSDLMILILLAAALISGVLGNIEDTIAILVIVILNAIIGAVQEYRAQRALEALRMMAAPEAKVLRDGQVQMVAASSLVPGDIVLLDTGMVVPADIRLFEASELQANESILTGESVAVEKRIESIKKDDAQLPGEKLNIAFKGTQITRGRASGIVVAIGTETELGQIATLLGEDGTTRTPLQQRLARFGSRLALFVLAICALIFFAGLMRGEPLILMFLTAVSLAVAAIPEALPAVVTISLAFGARKMSRHQALIRHLPSVETLGSVTVICSDKTGTLTQNRMRLEKLVLGNQLHDLPLESDSDSLKLKRLWQCLALSNDVQPGNGNAIGEPTELALYQAADEAGWNKQSLSEDLPRVAELPFDAERKCMTTLHQDGDSILAFTKGAPEQLLPRCDQQLPIDGNSHFQPESLMVTAEKLAEEGYRVLAIACREWDTLPSDLSPAHIESSLSFLGLAVLIDPPREEAYTAVKECRTAGITPLMITGDHPATAVAIATRLGIAEKGGEVITGQELEQLGATTLARRLDTVRVFARVSPSQKILIVQALQERGDFVAMTGDGVNDAPALKHADIGVAMGQKGTDVAREASDMVLLDDNFATIVTSVREGRRIFDNIRKFIKDTMSSNSGEIWTLFLAPFLGLPIPLLPIHILWINLVTDGLPGLAFTQEPAERGIMQRAPRPPNESIFAHGMWQHIIWVGLFVGGLSIASQAWAISRGVEYWQTITFTVLTISQLFHSLAVRSERESLFTIGLMSNSYMLGAVLLTVALQLMVIYVPLFNPVFKTQPLPPFDLAICFALSSLVLVGVEIEKWLIRRVGLYQGRENVG